MSGKRVYVSEALAIDALIQWYIMNDAKIGQHGPKNVYQCEDCSNWHFTSKSDLNPILEDEEVKNRIKKEKMAWEWERRLK